MFPEDGLQGFNFSRSSIAGYLETVPDPSRESWNPCTDPGRHNDTEVAQSYVCILCCYRADLVPGRRTAVAVDLLPSSLWCGCFIDPPDLELHGTSTRPLPGGQRG